jgi:hypothetical protein
LLQGEVAAVDIALVEDDLADRPALGERLLRDGRCVLVPDEAVSG